MSHLTDEQVDAQIEILNKDEFVRPARKERSIKMKRRKYLYDLQWLQNRGRELAAAGINVDNIEEVLFGEEEG